MMPDDIITRDSEGQLAVNTVSGTEANIPYNYDDCFTIDANGRRALRVVGAGGGSGGSVDSVNGKTGAVVIDAEDVGAIPQLSTMPAVTSVDANKIVQYVGTTSGSYTNGYFYKCVSDGQDPATYSWENIEVQEVGALPSQTGNSGKVLVTNGTTASWGGDISELNFENQGSWEEKIGYRTVSGYVCFGVVDSNGYMQFGYDGNNTAFLSEYNSALGTSDAKWSKLYVQAINNGNDITVPNVEGMMAVQVSTMPTAGASFVGKVYQYTGTTNLDYTHGYIYECVSDGGNPATYSWKQVDVMPAGSSLPSQTGNAGKFLTTDGTDTSWASALQNTATGSNSVGVVGTSSGNDSVVIGSGASDVGAYKSVVIGKGASTNDRLRTDAVLIGYNAQATSGNGVALGAYSSCGANGVALGRYAVTTGNAAIQIGYGTNTEDRTLKVGLVLNENYKLLDTDGTIPPDRIANTTGLTAGNYIPRLTIDAQGNKTITWVAE